MVKRSTRARQPLRTEQGILWLMLENLPKPDVDERTSFPGLFEGAEGTCRVLIWRKPMVVLVVDEGAETGLSITNGAERIRQMLLENYLVDAEEYRFFELYRMNDHGPDLVIYTANPREKPPWDVTWAGSSAEKFVEEVTVGVKVPVDPATTFTGRTEREVVRVRKAEKVRETR
jgi:hypothetical protein